MTSNLHSLWSSHLNQHYHGNLETYWCLEHFFPFNQITKQRTKNIFTPVKMQAVHKTSKPLLSYLTVKLEPRKAVQTLRLHVWRFGFAFQPSAHQSLTFYLWFPVLHRDLHGH